MSCFVAEQSIQLFSQLYPALAWPRAILNSISLAGTYRLSKLHDKTAKVLSCCKLTWVLLGDTKTLFFLHTFFLLTERMIVVSTDAGSCMAEDLHFSVQNVPQKTGVHSRINLKIARSGLPQNGSALEACEAPTNSPIAADQDCLATPLVVVRVRVTKKLAAPQSKDTLNEKKAIFLSTKNKVTWLFFQSLHFKI